MEMSHWYYLIIAILTSTMFLDFLSGWKIGFFESLIICIIVIFSIVKLFLIPILKSATHSKNNSSLKQNNGNSINHDIAFQWPSLGTFEFDVVGEGNYQNSIASIVDDYDEGTSVEIFKAILIPENQNKFDSMAVRVEINNKTVGYMSKDDARSFRRRLSSKKIGIKITSCNAEFIGGFIKPDGTRANYGVRLDIKPFY